MTETFNARQLEFIRKNFIPKQKVKDFCRFIESFADISPDEDEYWIEKNKLNLGDEK